MTGELLAPGPWTLDVSRCSVGFAVRHLKVARIRGRFTAFDGQLDADGPLRAVGTVNVASIDTGDAIRDERLRSAGFFDAHTYPTIHYVAEQDAADGRLLTGALTIRDLTRPLALCITTAAGPYAGVRITAQGRLSRRDFGLEWDGLMQAGEVLVSDRVDVVLDMFAVRAVARAPALAPSVPPGQPS